MNMNLTATPAGLVTPAAPAEQQCRPPPIVIIRKGGVGNGMPAAGCQGGSSLTIVKKSAPPKVEASEIKVGFLFNCQFNGIIKYFI
jgi:hypothetical protein